MLVEYQKGTPFVIVFTSLMVLYVADDPIGGCEVRVMELVGVRRFLLLLLKESLIIDGTITHLEDVFLPKAIDNLCEQCDSRL